MYRKKNYLIIGGDGLIGSCLYVHLRQQQKNVIATTRRHEFINADRIFCDLVSDQIPVLNNFSDAFLCAAITSITACETDPKNTSKMNVDATIKMARKLLDTGCRVVFISSNTVFDGKIKNPNENAVYCFSTEYGRQKAETEYQLLSLGAGIVIVRITKVISLRVKIFSTIIEKLRLNQKCEVFDDLFFCPISCDYLCEALNKITVSQLDGIFHLSGVEDISYAAFAYQIAQHIGADPDLVYPTPSKSMFKPQYAGLGMQRTKELLNILPQPTNLLISSLISNR